MQRVWFDDLKIIGVAAAGEEGVSIRDVPLATYS